MKVGVYKAWEVIVLCEVGEISTFGSEDCVKVGCEDYVESEGCVWRERCQDAQKRYGHVSSYRSLYYVNCNNPRVEFCYALWLQEKVWSCFTL